MDNVYYICIFVSIIVHYWNPIHFTSIKVTPEPIGSLSFINPLTAHMLTDTTCHYSLYSPLETRNTIFNPYSGH
jgi:hypothetical protein